jgi:phosphonate transport system substrate-binding protein
MAQLMKNGEVDLYFDSTYPVTLISDETGAQIILRRWRFGVEEYHSVIFASADSGITSLDELPGHMVAMDAPYSTSGFMLPAVKMVESGLKLIGKRGHGEAVAADEVGFVFSYDDENTLQWVLSGLVAAGVTDDYNFDVAFPDEATQNLIVLARTESTPRQVVVARPNLEPELLDAIKRVLVNMHEDESGLAPLESFQTTQFDEFPEGIEAATAHMREMMEIAKDISLP